MPVIRINNNAPILIKPQNDLFHTFGGAAFVRGGYLVRAVGAALCAGPGGSQSDTA